MKVGDTNEEVGLQEVKAGIPFKMSPKMDHGLTLHYDLYLSSMMILKSQQGCCVYNVSKQPTLGNYARVLMEYLWDDPN